MVLTRENSGPGEWRIKPVIRMGLSLFFLFLVLTTQGQKIAQLQVGFVWSGVETGQSSSPSPPPSHHSSPSSAFRKKKVRFANLFSGHTARSKKKDLRENEKERKKQE